MSINRRQLISGALATGLWPGNADAADASNVDRSKAERYKFKTPDSDIESGGAIIGINEPMPKVLELVLRFRSYKDILPRIQQSRIADKKPGHTDVYMRAPLLHGALNVWAVARFPDPVPWRREGKKLTGTMIRGNVEEWYGSWKMFPCGTSRTVLRLEMFMDVLVPVPERVITEELMWACDRGVTGVRDIVECGRSTVKDD